PLATCAISSGPALIDQGPRSRPEIVVDHVGSHFDAHVAHVEIGGELDDLEYVATIFAGHASELDCFASLQSKTFGRGRSGHAADVDRVSVPGEIDGVRPLPGDFEDFLGTCLYAPLDNLAHGDDTDVVIDVEIPPVFWVEAVAR